MTAISCFLKVESWAFLVMIYELYVKRLFYVVFEFLIFKFN